MALLKGTCHSILITGNLKKTNVLALELPFDDILNNLWQISINEIGQTYKKNSNIICGISCNFVNDISFNSSKQIINYFPILWQNVFKGKEDEHKISKFEKNWFYINSPQQEIKLFFHLFSNGIVTNNQLNLDCDLYITLLLQRVK